MGGNQRTAVQMSGLWVVQVKKHCCSCSVWPTKSTRKDPQIIGNVRNASQVHHTKCASATVTEGDIQASPFCGVQPHTCSTAASAGTTRVVSAQQQFAVGSSCFPGLQMFS